MLLHAIKVKIQGLQQQEQSITHQGFLFSFNFTIQAFVLPPAPQLPSSVFRSSCAPFRFQFLRKGQQEAGENIKQLLIQLFSSNMRLTVSWYPQISGDCKCWAEELEVLEAEVVREVDKEKQIATPKSQMKASSAVCLS